MQHDKLVCLDIETIPDCTLISDWQEGEFPPKPIWHQVVAISFVEARIIRNGEGQPETYAVSCCRSGGQADWDKRRLLHGRLAPEHGSYPVALLKADFVGHYTVSIR